MSQAPTAGMEEVESGEQSWLALRAGGVSPVSVGTLRCRRAGVDHGDVLVRLVLATLAPAAMTLATRAGRAIGVEPFCPTIQGASP